MMPPFVDATLLHGFSLSGFMFSCFSPFCITSISIRVGGAHSRIRRWISWQFSGFSPLQLNRTRLWYVMSIFFQLNFRSSLPFALKLAKEKGLGILMPVCKLHVDLKVEPCFRSPPCLWLMLRVLQAFYVGFCCHVSSYCCLCFDDGSGRVISNMHCFQRRLCFWPHTPLFAIHYTCLHEHCKGFVFCFTGSAGFHMPRQMHANCSYMLGRRTGFLSLLPCYMVFAALFAFYFQWVESIRSASMQLTAPTVAYDFVICPHRYPLFLSLYLAGSFGFKMKKSRSSRRKQKSQSAPSNVSARPRKRGRKTNDQVIDRLAHTYTVNTPPHIQGRIQSWEKQNSVDEVDSQQ